MAKPRKKRRKRKIRIGQGVVIRPKTHQSKDSLRTIEGRPPADIGPTFRVKIRKKK